MDLTNYTVSQATHKLKCRHQNGRNGYNYTMLCIVLGKMKSRKLKIIVFGERNWAHKQHVKKIRYVPPWKVIKLPIEPRTGIRVEAETGGGE